MLQRNCGILSDPMGKPDTVQMSQDMPIVHPTIKLSENHFKKNAAFREETYRFLEVQRRAYKDALTINFDDVVRFVFKLFNF